MRWARFRAITKRLALLSIVGLMLATIVAFVRHPWAVQALNEGRPSRTWPASGEFLHYEATDGSLTDVDRDATASEPFLEDFERSGGAALMVVRGDDVVHVNYADGFGPDTRFNSFSMSKSLVAVLVLKAVSDGVIPSVDSTLGDLWADAAETELAPITLRDLLDMRSGIAFERDPGEVGGVDTDKLDAVQEFGPFSPMAHLHIDGVDAVLADARLIEADRGQFNYQNLNTALLGRVLEEVYARPLGELLTETIVEPAGAGEFAWRRYHSDDRVSPYCCIYATVRWWAAVGVFLLDNGGDDPLLSEELFDYFLGRDLQPTDRADGEYRSQTRYDVLDRPGEELQGPFTYFQGLGGQVVYLVPAEKLVVVRFGERYQLLHSTLYEVARFTSP